MAAVWSEEGRLAAMTEVEICAAEAMAERGQIPRAAAQAIRWRAKPDAKRIAEIEAVTHHDVIALVTCLAESVGPEGRYIHRGMTSSDVLDTALAVQMKRAGRILLAGLDRLTDALKVLAERHAATPQMGRTHGVHAEPVTFGLKMALFWDEFRRHRQRLARLLPELCVGKISGAVGTYAHLDPWIEAAVCKRLGIAPAAVSSQIVPRDRHADFLGRLAGIGASLERFALEIRHLQRTEVAEAGEPFQKGQKGSSAMPHKQNPILCERICGLSRLLRGYAAAALENVALWHERDISHSSVERVALPDATLALDYMLDRATWLAANLRVDPERMRANLEASKGLWASEAVLLALIEKGLSREAAYAVVQRCALACWEAGPAGPSFEKTLAADAEVRKALKPAEMTRLFDLAHALRHVPLIFKRLGLSAGAGAESHPAFSSARRLRGRKVARAKGKSSRVR